MTTSAMAAQHKVRASPGLARVAVEQMRNTSMRQRQHHDEIFRPQREADGDAEQQPIPERAAAQRAMQGNTGQRPERQLDDVVVELVGGVVEVVQPVDDQHGHQRADAPISGRA